MKQLWATYSVTDHKAKKAFVADVMLYDKLVIPVPAPDEHARWEKHGWDEARQERILTILGSRAKPIVWDAQLRATWYSLWQEAKSVGAQTSREAMAITPNVLLQELPREVTGIVAVAAFDTAEDLRTGLQMRETHLLPGLGQVAQNAIPGQLAAVIGREFLVPNDSDLSDEDLLKEAVLLSSDARFRRKRAAYWRWQSEFLRDAIILDQRAMDDAVDEMNDLIADERAEVRRRAIKLGVSFAFTVGAASLGMFATPMAPVALGTAFLSIGAWAIDHIPDVGADPSPAAMCLSAQRHFGWGKQG